MKRRKFLVDTAAGAAAIVGLGITGGAQAPAAPPAGAQGGAAGRAGGAAGRGRAANVAPEKLARVSLMTYTFEVSRVLKFPWTANPSPTQTIDVLNLPQYYVDRYGITHLEFQHTHLVQSPMGDADPAFLREMKAKLDAAKVTATQINLEFDGPNGMSAFVSSADPALRQQAVDLSRKWVDNAVILGVKRCMLNQGLLNQDTKANAIAAWKQIAAYGRPKGVMISAETRGGGGGRGAAPSAPGTPPPPPAWMLLEEVIEAAGGYSNIDIGGAGAQNQQELHDAIKGMFKTSSGNMHIKSSPFWDIGLAVRYTESLGYKGTYSIEVNPEAAITIVYNAILASLA